MEENNTVMLSKEILRGEIKNQLKNIFPEEFRLEGARAAALLSSSVIWSRYETVFLFLSMNTEFDTQLLLETALKEGKKVFVPRVDAKKLVFCRIFSADGPWNKGSFGIREPFAEEKPVAPEDFPALVITPGFAFDRKENVWAAAAGTTTVYSPNWTKDAGNTLPLACVWISSLLKVFQWENTTKK